MTPLQSYVLTMIELRKIMFYRVSDLLVGILPSIIVGWRLTATNSSLNYFIGGIHSFFFFFHPHHVFFWVYIQAEMMCMLSLYCVASNIFTEFARSPGACS